MSSFQNGPKLDNESPVIFRCATKMDRLGLILLLIWAICAGCHANLSKNNNEDDAVKFLQDLDPKYLDAANKQMKTRWDYITNINDQTEKAQVSLIE